MKLEQITQLALGLQTRLKFPFLVIGDVALLVAEIIQHEAMSLDLIVQDRVFDGMFPDITGYHYNEKGLYRYKHAQVLDDNDFPVNFYTTPQSLIGITAGKSIYHDIMLSGKQNHLISDNRLISVIRPVDQIKLYRAFDKEGQSKIDKIESLIKTITATQYKSWKPRKRGVPKKL